MRNYRGKRLNNAVKVMMVLLMSFCLGFVLSPALAEELSFLKKNPALKAKLIKWEQEAPEAVKKEIHILRTGGAVDKGYAAVWLGKMGARAKGAILALIETFRDHTGLERKRISYGGIIPEGYTSPADEAVKALVKIGSVAVEPLIAALRDQDSDVREEATEALGEIKDARAVEPLIAALKDKDSDVRAYAAEALGNIGDLRAVGPLIAAIAAPRNKYYVETKATEALVKIGTPAVEPLIAALKDEDPRVRCDAAIALGEIKDARAVEPLIAVLRDKHLFVRKEAVEALDELKDARAVKPLIGILRDEGRDEDSGIRWQAAEALEKIDPNWWQGQAAKNAVSDLIAALKDKNSDVREAAAKVLVKIGMPAVEPLIAALKDENSDVRKEAAKALGEITGQNFGEDPEKWSKWWEQNKESFVKGK